VKDMTTLAQWASSHTEELLAPLGTRWAHVQAVAERAGHIASIVLPDAEWDLLVAAAWLHDIGYVPAVASTGLHPLDGARHLEALGIDRRLCCLVAHHSGATFEAEERGLGAELAVFEREDSPVMDALVYADMTTGPAGQPLDFEVRIAEILGRYPPEHPVHRAISRSHPVLAAAVDRTARQLVGA
jgi:HD superfamily phosphodiesterase